MSEDSVCHQILLIEDNPGDVGLVRRALAAGDLHTQLHVAHDGPEALDYLLNCSQKGDSSLPDLILLDLSLPMMDGCEVLLSLKQSDALLSIPVVVLSSSQAEQDVLRTYEHFANCYVTKPLDLDQYMKTISAIQNFWLKVAKLPRNRHHE